MKRIILLIVAAIWGVTGQEVSGWATKMTSAPSIASAEAKKLDTQGHIPLIELFTPIFYLHSDEKDYPITAEEYFTGPNTSVDYQKDGAFTSLIPKGQVTMQKLYDLWVKSRPEYAGEDKIALPPLLHIYVSGNTLRGSNPTYYKNTAGILTTPVYVVTWEQGNTIYLQYVTLFAENYGYGILQSGYHVADLEHVTIKLDKQKTSLFMNDYTSNILFKQNIDKNGLREALGEKNPITAIYYGSHGDKDGYWMPGSHSHVGYEGTHPLVYVAKGGHGNYPRAGAYVRVGGTANDETERGIRWEADPVLILPETDPNFDAETMGWIYFPGYIGWQANPTVNAAGIKLSLKGKRETGAVSNLWKKSWFMKEDVGMKSYNEYDSRRFCSYGKNHGSCLKTNAIKSGVKGASDWLGNLL